MAHGDDSLLVILGATLYVLTGILLYVIYDERKKARANAVKECPDCLEKQSPASRLT